MVRLCFADADVGDGIDDDDNDNVIFHEEEGSVGGGAKSGQIQYNSTQNPAIESCDDITMTSRERHVVSNHRSYDCLVDS